MIIQEYLMVETLPHRTRGEWSHGVGGVDDRHNDSIIIMCHGVTVSATIAPPARDDRHAAPQAEVTKCVILPYINSGDRTTYEGTVKSSLLETK